jgi:hypothetical protein
MQTPEIPSSDSPASYIISDLGESPAVSQRDFSRQSTMDVKDEVEVLEQDIPHAPGKRPR